MWNPGRANAGPPTRENARKFNQMHQMQEMQASCTIQTRPIVHMQTLPESHRPPASVISTTKEEKSPAAGGIRTVTRSPRGSLGRPYRRPEARRIRSDRPQGSAPRHGERSGAGCQEGCGSGVGLIGPLHNIAVHYYDTGWLRYYVSRKSWRGSPTTCCHVRRPSVRRATVAAWAGSSARLFISQGSASRSNS